MVFFAGFLGGTISIQETLLDGFLHQGRSDSELIQPLILATIESCPQDVDPLCRVLGKTLALRDRRGQLLCLKIRQENKVRRRLIIF